MLYQQISRLATLIVLGSSVILDLCASKASASVMFSFQEVGGSVLMEASGTLNTSLLIPVIPYGWGGGRRRDQHPP